MGLEEPCGGGNGPLLLILILLVETLEQVPFWQAVTWCGGTLLGFERRCGYGSWSCAGLATLFPGWHGAEGLHPFPLQKGLFLLFFTGLHLPPFVWPHGVVGLSHSLREPWLAAGVPKDTTSSTNREAPRAAVYLAGNAPSRAKGMTAMQTHVELETSPWQCVQAGSIQTWLP